MQGLNSKLFLNAGFTVIISLLIYVDFVVADENIQVQGIDVSHYQGDIDWQAVRDAGIEFVFIKCTDSTNDKDSKFEANWAGAKDAGIPRGAYHFFHPEKDPGAQANFFLKCFDEQVGELSPVVDVERYKDDFAKLECQDVLDKINAFAKTVSQKLKDKIIIYTNPSTWEQNMCGADIFDDNGIWIAEYSATLKLDGKWKKWNFWQYSQSGTIKGIDGSVDLNRFNGTADQFEAFINLPDNQ